MKRWKVVLAAFIAACAAPFALGQPPPQEPGGGPAADHVKVDGVEASDPDFRSQGDVDFIRCTGVGTPDAACLASEDVLGRLISSGLEMKEVDGNPTVPGVGRIVVTNGTLTDDGTVVGKRQVTLTTGGGSGAGTQVSVDGGSVLSSADFRDEGDINVTRCTGPGSPDSACLEVNDVILRYKANSIDLGTDTTGFYALGDAEGGAATTGDSATGFFGAGALEVTRGGTGAAPTQDDRVLIADSSSAATWRNLPDSDAATQKLQYDQSTNTFSAGTDDDIPEAADYSNLTGGAGIVNSPTGTIALDTNETNSVASGAVAPTNDRSLVIDTNGDGSTLTGPVLQFRSGSTNFILPGVDAYPTATTPLIIYNPTNHDLEWGNATRLESNEVGASGTIRDILYATDPQQDAWYTDSDGGNEGFAEPFDPIHSLPSGSRQYELYLVDFTDDDLVTPDPDGDIDYWDLQYALDTCGAHQYGGTNAGGCRIVMPRGEIQVNNTLKIATVTSTLAASITLEGQGACSRNVVPPSQGPGTRIVWTGSEGGTVFQIGDGTDTSASAYGIQMHFRDFCIVTDSDLTAGRLTGGSNNGNGGAGKGFYFPGYSQGVTFDHINVWGPSGSDSRTIISFADAAGDSVTVTTSSAHLLLTGDTVEIRGTTYHDGIFQITGATGGADTTFEITDPRFTPFNAETPSGANCSTGVYCAYPRAPWTSSAVYVTWVDQNLGDGQPPDVSGRTAQNDKMQAWAFYTRGLSFAWYQDALQPLINVIQGGEVYANRNSLRISGGNVDLRDAIIGSDAPFTAAIDMYGYAGGANGAQETLFSNVYFESGGHCGQTILRYGISQIDSTPGNNQITVFENSYFNWHATCTGTKAFYLLKAVTGPGKIVFKGNHFNVTNGTPTIGMNISNYNGSQCCGEVIFDDNYTNPWQKGVGFWSPLTITPGTTNSKPNLWIKNFIRDADGIEYDDRDFDWTRDAGEGLTAGIVNNGTLAIPIGTSSTPSISLQTDVGTVTVDGDVSLPDRTSVPTAGSATTRFWARPQGTGSYPRVGITDDGGYAYAVLLSTIGYSAAPALPDDSTPGRLPYINTVNHTVGQTPFAYKAEGTSPAREVLIIDDAGGADRYLKLDSANLSTPATADCNESVEVGRMIVLSGSNAPDGARICYCATDTNDGGTIAWKCVGAAS